MASLWQDLRYAFRCLKDRPAFSAIGIITLALGIGANSAIFTFVNTLLLRPLPFSDAERLVRVQSIRGQEAGKLMVREWEELERETDTFDSVAGYYPSQYNMADGGPPEAIRACMTTSSLFRVLGAKFVHGGAWLEGSHRVRTPVVVLDHSLWQQRLGSDPGISGKTILLDALPHHVAGVLAPGFHFPVRQGLYRAAFLYHDQNRNSRSLFIVARLKSGVSVAEGQARLDAFASRLEQEFPETNRGIRFRISPLRDQFVGEVRPYLLLTWLLVGAVLLIACANLGNLLLSRALTRQREIAIRFALGAGPLRILQQMFAEGFLLATGGAILGLALSTWWTHVLRQLINIELPPWMSFDVDLRVLGFTAGLVVLTALFTGTIPALLMARANLAVALQASSRGSSTGRRQQVLRNALMAGELALSVILLVAAGLLLRSFLQLLDTPAGFRRGHMLTLHVDPPFSKYQTIEQTALFYREAQRQLSSLAGVEAVTTNQSLPFVGNENYGKPAIVLEGQSDQDQLRNPFVNVQIVSPNYLDVMGVPLLRGRSFHDSDRLETQPVAIISRPLARRLFGEADPLQRRFRFVGLLGTAQTKQEAWFTIVGIAEGVRSQGLLANPSLDVYLSNQQQFAGDTFFVLRTRHDPARLGPALPRIFQQIDPEQAIFDIATMDKRIEDTVWQRRLAGSVSFWFGVLALVLSAIGIYGVLSYSVSQRTREMGIRLALGSTPSGILRLVIRQGLRVALIGIAMGMAGAVILAVFIRALLHGIGFLDPITFATVGVALGMASFFACYIPARRAARVDPISTLKQE
jgi:putative ABC transport system permease protein